jgi:hypothetical protein
MADRRSISSDNYENPVIEEANFSLRGTAQTLNQVSSSAKSAKENRTVKAAAALDSAVRERLLQEEKDSKKETKDK